MAEGFAIGRGFIEAEVVIDESQVRKATESAGDKASRGFSSSFGSKLKGMAKTVSSGFGGVFAKSLVPVLGAAGTGAVAVAGPAIGAALGAAITAGISLAGIGAGIALVADRPEVKEAASKFKESLFGMSKEDREKLDANIESTKKKIEAMQKRLSRTDPKSDTAKYLREDIAAAQVELKGFQQKQKTSMNGLLRDAAKPFIKPTVDAIGQFSAMMQRLGPSFNRIFAALAPHVTTLTKGIIGGIEGFMPGLEKMLLNSGPMIQGIANSITAMGKGTGAFLGFMTDAVKNFRTLWGGDGGTGPFSNLPGIVASIKGLGGVFKEVFSNIFKAIGDNKTQFATFFNFILGFSKALWSGVGPVFKALGSAITGVINILGGLITFFQGVFTGNWKKAGDGLLKIWDGLWNGVKGILTNLGQALVNITLGIWNNIKGPFIGFANWFTSGWSKAWDGAKNDLSRIGNAIKNVALGIWNGIKGAFTGFKNWFVGGWSTLWNGAKTTILNIGTSIKDGFMSRFNNLKNNLSTAIGSVKGFITSMRDHISNMVGSIKGKFDSFKDNTIAAFTKAKDGVKKVWDKLQEVAKSPVNFVIDPVYARIRELWNNVAGKVGLGQLPVVNKFAKGGIAPGSGRGDTVPAMLTPGEGILTVDEMRKLGGPRGFQQLRDQIQYFADGGVVGWMKDKVGGAIRGGLYKVAKGAADKWVFPAINQLQGGNGFPGLMKAGANTLINKVLDWIKVDDKKNPVPAGGSGVGYKRMMEILRSRFPGLPLISGFRPGSRTLSGNTSYHASGRAVDVKPSAAIAKFIHDNYRAATKELITPYQQYNLHNGRSHRYTGAVWNQHNYAGGNAHTHWAMDQGGVLPPRSTTLVTNATREKEYALTMEQLRKTAGKTVNINTPGAIVLDMSKYKNMDEVIEAVLNIETYLNQGIA